VQGLHHHIHELGEHDHTPAAHRHHSDHSFAETEPWEDANDPHPWTESLLAQLHF
jgi:hypothetical protein